jgi:predicted transcriptional regulator YdeE
MEPTITKTSQMLLVGFGFYGDPFSLSPGWTEENEIGRLCNRFMAYLAQHGQQIKHIKGERVMYELHIYNEETARTGEFEVFVGIEVERLEEVPLALSAKLLPPTSYARFTLAGQQIVGDWPMLILTDWLPESGYESDFAYSIQRYDERFKGLDRLDESEIEVYIPLKQGG